MTVRSLPAVAFFFLPLVAHAGCASFDQLSSEAETLLAPLGDLSSPDCSQKPDESRITDLITCFEAIPATPARMRSDADLELASLYGAITQCYVSGPAQTDPGRKSFHALVAATQDDPTYETAWLRFSETVAGMAEQGFFQRKAIEIGLGISIDDELSAALAGLSQLPQDADVTAEIAKLKSLQRHESGTQEIRAAR